MLEVIVKLALGPLLLMQGLYTRWVTPRLPEAEGERRGDAGQGPELRLLVVGDSAAAGVGVQNQEEALTGKLVARLAVNHRVSWRLLAESGVNTNELLQMLERASPEPFDVAVVSVGVNDVTSSVAARDWASQQGRLIDLLEWRFGVRQIVLSPVPPMHAFPALPQPLRWFLGSRARRFNLLLAELVSRRHLCTLLAGKFPLVAGLMADDGFHPGPAIYSMWADDAAAIILTSRAISRIRQEC
ncbi:TPA: SGNH/GDSL hydrolase family protein [Pseudomonas aeruginosa]|nr:SGNH/GDSL hydrolase family protein [Pseudomonas aeruginosa]